MSDKPEDIEIVRDGSVVELRIDGREDLALPFLSDDAVQLAFQILRAANDAKRYERHE